MEIDNTEIKETTDVNAITSKSIVLSIGDDEGSINKRPEENKNSFHDDVRKYLCVLTTGIKTPLPTIDIWNSMDKFGVARIKKNNRPSQYRFYCLKGNADWRSHLISIGQVYNAKHVLKYVRNRLKEENWISEDTITAPLKTFKNKVESDLYIQHIAAEAFNAESKRMLEFILYLHRNYRNK